MWFLFTVAFSCYLRVEINTQLIRNEFYEKREQWQQNISSNLPSNLDPLLRKDCITMGNFAKDNQDRNGTETKQLTEDELQAHLDSGDLKICHPQNASWWLTDSSRILFMSMLVSSGLIWFVLVAKTCRDQLPDLPPIKTWSSSPLLPVLLAKNCSKNRFRNATNLFTTTVVFVMMLICYHSDGQNLKLQPARPFLDFDDGFRLIEAVLLLLALYFVVDFLNEIVVKKRSWSNWAQLTDPSSIFQLVTSLSAIVALLRKCYLTSGRNSGEGPATAAGAIGITLAYLCLILKHGRYNFTAIGNFATMFHINVPLKDFADGRWMYL